MNPYHDLEVDAETHDIAVIHAIDRLKRGVYLLVAVFIIFGFVVGQDSNATHGALCKLRNNASDRVKSSTKLIKGFSDAELQQKFHLTRKDALAGIARDKKAVDAMADLDCGGWWFF